MSLITGACHTTLLVHTLSPSCSLTVYLSVMAAWCRSLACSSLLCKVLLVNTACSTRWASLLLSTLAVSKAFCKDSSCTHTEHTVLITQAWKFKWINPLGVHRALTDPCYSPFVNVPVNFFPMRNYTWLLHYILPRAKYRHTTHSQSVVIYFIRNVFYLYESQFQLKQYRLKSRAAPKEQFNIDA